MKIKALNQENRLECIWQSIQSPFESFSEHVRYQREFQDIPPWRLCVASALFILIIGGKCLKHFKHNISLTIDPQSASKLIFDPRFWTEPLFILLTIVFQHPAPFILFWLKMLLITALSRSSFPSRSLAIESNFQWFTVRIHCEWDLLQMSWSVVVVSASA